jgi:tetratricopeptide (TPR) repeat protein
MNQKLRCLSVRQPWAWAIVTGLKDIENRSWGTDYRGPIVIHAATNKAVATRFLRNADAALPKVTFDYGALVGVANLTDVLPLTAELESDPWAWGPFCWRLAAPRRFRVPIPAKGKLNLYTLSEELSRSVQEALHDDEPARFGDHEGGWSNHLSGGVSDFDRLSGLYDSYVQLGDGHSAVRLAERMLTLNEDADAYVDRAVGKAILEEPDFQGALKDLDRALEIDPGSGRAYAVRSIVNRNLGIAERAEADLAKAKELGFDDVGRGEETTEPDE